MLRFLAALRQLVATPGELATTQRKLARVTAELEQAHRDFITADTEAGEEMRAMRQQHRRQLDDAHGLVRFLCGHVLDTRDGGAR